MIIPNDYAQANFGYSGPALPTGAEWTLGLNVELFSGTPLDAANELATAYGAANLDGFHSNDTDLVSILVKFGPNATGPSAELAPAITGHGGAAAATPNVSYLVQKQTGFGGRTGRGRLYFPGVTEDSVLGSGQVVSTWVGDMDIAFEAFRTALVAEGLIPTLLHGPDSPISTPMPITSFATSSQVATQRRRNRR